MRLKKPRSAKPGEINYPAIDRFTFVHFAIGIGYGFFGLSFITAISLALAWEIVENPLKAHFPAIFPNATADTIKNSLFDTLAVILGWLISYYLLSQTYPFLGQ